VASVKNFIKQNLFFFAMEIHFTKELGEFPYKAAYIGFETPPVAPAFGIYGFTGQSRRTPEDLITSVLQDLAGYQGKIKLVFEGLPKESVSVMKTAFKKGRLEEQL
jgi:hypothetical protein